LNAARQKMASFRGHFCEALVARNLQPKALQQSLLPNVIVYLFFWHKNPELLMTFLVKRVKNTWLLMIRIKNPYQFQVLKDVTRPGL